MLGRPPIRRPAAAGRAVTADQHGQHMLLGGMSKVGFLGQKSISQKLKFSRNFWPKKPPLDARKVRQSGLKWLKFPPRWTASNLIWEHIDSSQAGIELKTIPKPKNPPLDARKVRQSGLKWFKFPPRWTASNLVWEHVLVRERVENHSQAQSVKYFFYFTAYQVLSIW